jgi:hypothetical protein
VDRVSGGTGKAGLREGALPVPVWEQRYRLWQRRLLFFLVVLEECFVRSLTWRTLGRPFCCLLFGYDEREGGGGGKRMRRGDTLATGFIYNWGRRVAMSGSNNVRWTQHLSARRAWFHCFVGPSDAN